MFNYFMYILSKKIVCYDKKICFNMFSDSDWIFFI